VSAWLPAAVLTVPMPARLGRRAAEREAEAKDATEQVATTGQRLVDARVLCIRHWIASSHHYRAFAIHRWRLRQCSVSVPLSAQAPLTRAQVEPGIPAEPVAIADHKPDQVRPSGRASLPHICAT
jgi:hypothetical protein